VLYCLVPVLYLDLFVCKYNYKIFNRFFYEFHLKYVSGKGLKIHKHQTNLLYGDICQKCFIFPISLVKNHNYLRTFRYAGYGLDFFPCFTIDPRPWTIYHGKMSSIIMLIVHGNPWKMLHYFIAIQCISKQFDSFYPRLITFLI
jgi:hypothetical protein